MPAPRVRTACAAALLLLGACAGEDPGRRPEAAAAPDSCDVLAARATAERLGARLQLVPLLAPDSVRAPAISRAYAELVTPALLARWLADPGTAPGRTASSPWPGRIEVDSVAAEPGGECRVRGDVVYVSSVELAAGGGTAARAPVRLLLRREPDGWRVADYEEGAAAADPAGADAAAAGDVIRRYYAEIAAGRFPSAHRLWADSGRASGQSLAEFERGFAATASVAVEVGSPGRVEGAAGSRYVRVPVTVRAVTTDSEAQWFTGTYTLRRNVVPGAAAEQREWRLHSADLVTR